MCGGLIAVSSLLSLVLVAPVFAADFDPGRPGRQPPSGIYQGGGRVGGDTVADAVAIPSIPFSDTGSTCGFSNDYDAVCPYAGSTAPDVVYSYLATVDADLAVDLCTSYYDTKAYVWEDVPGNVIACNDDGCFSYAGYQSRIEHLFLAAGHNYYLVIDGYGPDCGQYALDVVTIPPCVVECPSGALQEGEVPCPNTYPDEYNGGCSGLGFTPILAGAGDCTTMCGTSCTYLYNGWSYRDTDWYASIAAGGTSTATGRAEFPLQILLIYGAQCNNLQYVIGTAPTCQSLSLSREMVADQDFWVWVGPTAFEGIPESNYLLEVCGILPGGACCIMNDCILTTPTDCEMRAGLWLGTEITCDPNPCLGGFGACCVAEECFMLPQPNCLSFGGSWLGPDTDCDPNPCPPSTPVEETTWGMIKHTYR